MIDTAQLEYRYSTDTVRMQYRCSTDTVQVQYRYSTDTIQYSTDTVQLQYYSYMQTPDTRGVGGGCLRILRYLKPPDLTPLGT